jgi:hypothetical protein
MFSAFTKWFMGRTTTFCVGFFVVGNVLHFLHQLDATYIAYMATLMGFVIGKSHLDDRNGAAQA